MCSEENLKSFLIVISLNFFNSHTRHVDPMQEKQPMSGLQFCADVLNFKSSQLFLLERCCSICTVSKKAHILVIASGSWCGVRPWDIQQKRCSPCSSLVSVYPSCVHTLSSFCALCTSPLPWWTLLSWAAVWSEDERYSHSFRTN